MAQTIKIKRSATSGNKLTGSNSIAGEIGMNTADKSLYIQTGSTDASVVTVYDDSILHLDDSNNRVGIGTTSPGVELEVAGANPILRIRENDQTNKFGDILVNSNRIRIRSRAGSNNGSIAFEGNNGTSTTEYARFNNSGDLGIGTNSPAYKLDVTGTGRFTGAVTLDSTLSFSDTTATNVLDLNNNNIIDVNRISFADAGPNEGLEWNGGNTKIFESPDDLTTNTAGNLQFVYNGTRRLSVNNTGIDVNGTITGATNISKQVARTVTGGTGTEDGPNTWAKLATYSVTNNYNDGTFIYGVVTEEQSLPTAGTIIVRVRWGDLAGSVNPTVKVEWTSKNSGNSLGTDAFKLIGDGVSDDIELWVQKDVNYGCIELWELAYRKEDNNSVSVSYENNSAWQSSTPTGTAVNETSGTLTFDGKEVLLGDEFNNTTDFKLSGKLNVLASVNTNDAAYIRNSGTGAAFAVNQQGTGDILRLDDNSTTKLIVKDGGRVGLGTTAPNTNLHVKVEADGNGIIIQRNSTTGGTQAQLSFMPSTSDSSTPNLWIKGIRGAGGFNDNFMTFGTNSLERMRIDAAGNIAIGQTATPQKLTVAGNITVTGTTGIQIATISRVSNAGRFHLNDSGGTTRLELNSVGDSYFNASGGKVGIGTTTPSGTLHVKSTGNGEINIERASGALINIQAQASAAYIGTNTNHQFGLKSNGSVRLKIATNGAISFNDAFTFPTSDGQANQVLKTDGSGNVTWATEAATSASTSMSDADGDTKIQVEESSDEDIIRFDTAGTERMTLSPSVLSVRGTTNPEIELLPNGTVGNADLRFDGTTFDIRSNSSSASLLLSTSSTERLRIDSSGRVGIGTTSPSQKLQVAGTILADTALTASSGTTAIGIGAESSINDTSSTYKTKLITENNNGKLTTYQYGSYLTLKAGVEGTNYANNWAKIELRDGGSSSGTTSHMKFYTSGDQRMVINDGGNVGIGTVSPGNKLQVNAASDDRIVLNQTAAYNFGLQFQYAGTRTWDIYNNGVASSKLFFYSEVLGDSAMTIDTSGKVGIGTTSPSSRLNIVHSTNATNGIIVQNATTGTGARSNLRLLSDAAQLDIYATSSTYSGVSSWADAGVISTSSNASGGLIFNAQLTGHIFQTSTNERMRIDSSGNVGIGTSSPQDLLHLSASSPVLRMTNTSDSGKSTIEFWDNQSGTSQTGEVFFEDAGNVFGIQGNANGIIFRTSNTFPGAERMRLNNNGYLGIGTSSPSSMLHIVMPNLSGGNNGNGITVQDDGAQLKLEVRKGTGGVNAARRISFYEDGGTYPLYLQEEGGFVGVGMPSTATAGAMLHVQNRYDVTSHPDKTGIRLSRLSGTTQDWLLSTGVASVSNSYLAIRDVTNSAYRMVFDTSGNVGIGTTTPDTRLDVTTSGVNGLVLNSDTSTTTNSARLFFKTSGGTVGMLNVNNSLSFRTGMTINSSSGTERLNINSTHVASNNTVLLKGANDNSGKADFALNTGGSPTVSLHGTQVQLGSSDQNWNGKISYISGSGVYFSAWDNDLRLTTSGGSSSGARNIRFEPQASGGSSTLRMIVNGDGNVGIGTDSPADRLEIKDNHSQLRLTDSDDNKFVQFSYSGGFLAVRNNNASTSVNLFSLHEDGDFGIGTLSPSSALHVKRTGASSEILSESDTGYATVKLDSATGAGAGVRFLKAGTEKVRLESIPTSHDFQIKMSGTERFRVTQSGNVGIGTTNPVQKLQVDGSIYANGGRFFVNNNSGISAVGDLVLQTHNGSGYQTSMHLDGADNHVGIGTTTPQQKLTVRGATLFSAGDEGSRHGTEFNWVKSNTGSSGNGVWYKVADISLTNTAYSAMAFEAYYETGLNNFGSHNYLDVREVFVSIVRNNTTSTNNSPDSATLRGRTSDIRVYKTAAGTYELQARHNSQNAKYAVRVRVFQTNGGTITPKMDGSTAGTNSGGTEYTVAEPAITEGVRRYLADIDSSRIHLGNVDLYPSGNTNYIHVSGSGVLPQSTTASSNGSLGTSTYLWNGVFSRRFQGEVGSAGAPTFTFSEDSNTGMYDEWYDQSNSKRQLSFSVDGTRRMYLNEAGVWSALNYYLPTGGSLRSFDTYTEISNGTSGNGFRMRNTANGVDSLIVTSAGNGTFAGSLTVNGNIDLNANNINDINQLNGTGGSGWLDFNMDTDNVYPQSTSDNQTVLGSVTHMNFVGDSNGNGTGGNFYWGYGVSSGDAGTFTQTMSLTRTGDLDVAGALTATTKSFDIEHPTKEGMRLHHGSLEGPEHGVYVRGKSQTGIIELPDYWTGLVDEDTITVQLTAIGKPQELYVEKIEDNKVYVNGENYFYFVQAERKDIEKFEVEYAV